MEDNEGDGGPSGLTCGVWVPLGSCKQSPEKYQASPEDVQRARNKAAMLAAEAGEEADQVMDEDDEDEVEEEHTAAMMGEIEGNEEDEEDDDDDDGPGLDVPTQGAEGIQAIESDDESEINDLQIRSDDLVFMCTHQRGNGTSSLEVYVYDDENENIYLHHDVMLPAIPLSVSWAPAGRNKDGAVDDGSFAAVSTFLPFIEVWDLDIIDSPDPAVTLGGCKRASDNYRAKTLSPSLLKKSSHKDAVLCTRWNPGVKKVLASGSADLSVKLWDLTTAENLMTSVHHEGPIQCLEWFPQTPQSLLTGGFDQQVVLLDCRTQKPQGKLGIGGTPECIAVSPFEGSKVYMTTDAGQLLFYDVRNPQSAVWTTQAHQGEAGLAVNPAIDGLLATAGVDNAIKLWDVRTEPTALSSRDLQQGRVFSLHFSADKPTYLLASGDRGKPLVYCVTSDVSTAFTTPS